jgi:putative phosphoesterase
MFVYNESNQGLSMRIAFLSDIHGNYTALKAVLADMASQPIDQVVCLGDVVTLGPQPLEVLNALRKLQCSFVKGNHDAATLDPENAVQYQIASHLIPDLYWCRDRLSSDDLELINSFKPTHEINLPNGDQILAFHGSPISHTDIIQSTTPNELLDVYFKGQKANVFIGGHSHIQMVRRYDDKLILNSGSIGNAFRFAYSPGNQVYLLPWAEYMIIEQNGKLLDVEARRVEFDTNEVIQRIKESQLPCSSWWLSQYSG